MQQPIAGRAEQQPPHPVKYHYADTFWCVYITSVISACIAELGINEIIVGVVCFNQLTYFSATYPLDLTKTRLQIQGEALTANLNNAKVSYILSNDMLQLNVIRRNPRSDP